MDEKRYSHYRETIGTTVNLACLIADHAKWSQTTFGMDGVCGPIGALKHLQKEAAEAMDRPGEIEEYADCFLLLLDASRRAGFSFAELVAGAEEKLLVNKARCWPPCVDGEPCEHHKSPELGAVDSSTCVVCPSVPCPHCGRQWSPEPTTERREVLGELIKQLKEIEDPPHDTDAFFVDGTISAKLMQRAHDVLSPAKRGEVQADNPVPYLVEGDF